MNPLIPSVHNVLSYVKGELYKFYKEVKLPEKKIIVLKPSEKKEKIAQVIYFGAPVKVSPVIKFGRYTFLLMGIFYGLTKNIYYSYKEKSYQQHKAILEEAKKEALNAEKEQ